jgi:hypothetical protein
MGLACSTFGLDGKYIKTLVGKPKMKETVGRWEKWIITK